MEAISPTIQAATGFLSVVLTGMLVYFYKGMRDAQAKQADIIEKQSSIQEKQSEIQNMQTEMMRGQNRPILSITSCDYTDDMIHITAENRGNGIIKKIALEFCIYLKCTDLEDISNGFSNPEWEEEDTKLNYSNDEEYLELRDLNFSNINKGSGYTLMRPEENTTDYTSIPPDEEKNGYIYSRCNLIVNGEYDEKTTSSVIELIREMGLDHAIFHWQFRYKNLAGVKYYEHLDSREVDVYNVNNIEEVIAHSERSNIFREETTTVNYYELPE